MSSEKSSWPGVSSRLKTHPACSNVIAEVTTEMPRSRSMPIQSEHVRRCSPSARTLPESWMASPARSKVLGQGGLAGVGVGDDREGAAAGDLGVGVGHRGVMQWRWGGKDRPAPCVSYTGGGGV